MVVNVWPDGNREDLIDGQAKKKKKIELEFVAQSHTERW